MEDDDDQSTCVEPVISYCSPSATRGVKEKSNNKFNSFRSNYNDFSSHHTSVNNTIMLPFISSDGSIRTEKSNKNINNSKENSSNNYYMKFDSTRNKTIGSKSDNEQKNNESVNLKITHTYNDLSPNILKRSTFICQRFSMGLPETNYQEMLNFRSSQIEINYESDNVANYNKKIDENKENHDNTKDSIRTAKTRRNKIINDEKIPSLFLKTEKQDKKNNNSNNNNKNIFVFKSKKRRKTQKVQKESKINLKKKDKAVLFYIEKSKSFSNEELHRNCNSSYKKEKSNGNLGEGKMSKGEYRSNKNVKNIKDSINKEDAIKKNWTSKIGLIDKFKSVGKTDKKKKKKNDRKISFKDHNFNNKLVKLMFSRNQEVKNNKYESSGLKMLREHMNNRNYKEKKEDEKYKKEKIKKSGKRSLKNSKDKNETEKEKDKDKKRLSEELKSEDRRQSGFLSKDDVIKKIFDIKASYKEKRASKKERTKHYETTFNNESKKELKIKDNNNDSNNNILLKISRRKRSISLHYRNNKMQEISEALRAKLPKKISNLNLINASSTNVIKKAKKKKKLSDVEVFLKKNLKDEQYSLFSKFTNTVYTGPDFTKYIISCFELIMDMDKDSQTRLKTKINFNFPKSKKKGLKKRIALFDLDETLVHCTGDIKSKKAKYQHTIDISLPGKNSVKVGINLRPLWKETLDLIKKKYHIVVHTASHQTYADAVLDFMDPEKKYFKYRLYRNNCSLVDIDDVKFYVKDLDIFNEYYDLKDIVIIDNSVLSFAYHLYNGIPIVPYYEGENDNFLYVVGLYLDHIYKANDLREANKKLINLDYFYGIAKSQVENADNIIDEESDVIEEGEGEENSQNEIPEESTTNINAKGDDTFKSKKSKHKSGKTAINNRGGMLGSHSPLSARKTFKELSENKLMSNSNLFNMYLEMNDNKNKINNHFSLTAKETKKEKSLQSINFSNYAKLVKEDINIINKEEEDNKERECKSEPDINHPSFIKMKFISNTKILRRNMSLVDADYLAERIKNSIMGSLKIIKTNFSNKFKDLENISDNNE